MLLEEEKEFLISFGKKFLVLLKKSGVSDVQQKMFSYYLNTYLRKADVPSVDSDDETLGELLDIGGNKGREKLFLEMKEGVLELFDILDIVLETDHGEESLSLFFEKFCDKYKAKYLVEM